MLLEAILCIVNAACFMFLVKALNISLSAVAKLFNLCMVNAASSIPGGRLGADINTCKLLMPGAAAFLMGVFFFPLISHST